MYTTEFDEFLDVELFGATPPEIYELYNVVRGDKGSGTFKAVKGGDCLSVRGPTGRTLRLVSPKAVQAFIAHLSKRYMGGMNADEWYTLEMAKQGEVE